MPFADEEERKGGGGEFRDQEFVQGHGHGEFKKCHR